MEGSLRMKSFVKKYQDNGLYSQNGEYGIIREVIKRIGLLKGLAIEFGAADGFYCSNTADLCNEFNWIRILYDLVPTGNGVLFKDINESNVNELGECDFMSIDIDGNDFNIWKAYKWKPAIVVIEINSSLDPNIEFFHPDKGSSFCTMNRLASDKGYFLLCHTGNCIYVDLKYKDLFPEIHLIVTSEYFFNYSWMPKPEGMQYSTKETRLYRQ